MSEKAKQQKPPKQIGDPALYEFPCPPCKELSAATMPSVPQGKICNKWNVLKTIEDWQQEFNSHYEWRSRSISQMQRDKISGANAFYQALSTWSNREAKGDKLLRKRLIEKIFPRRQRDWSHLKSIEDWKREFDSHPEWKDLSTHQIQLDKASGVYAFYRALSAWSNREAKRDKLLRKRLIEKIFPRRQRDWSNLKTIEDWKRKFDSRPEWKNRSISQMNEDKVSGAQAFYVALRTWINRETKGDPFLRQRLIEKIFPLNHRDRSHLKTIEDWESEFDSHPEWRGRSISQMQRDKRLGASAFYAVFNNWIRHEAKGDKLIRRRLIEKIFPRRYRDRSHLKTIEDWESEFDSHPEWRGRSISQMQRDKISGANAWYTALKKWADREAKGDKVLRQQLIGKIFPLYHRDRSNLKTIEDWKNEFDSHPEWRSRSIHQMQRDKRSAASSFYSCFYKWTHREANGDKLLRQRLVEKIFPKRHRDWSNLKSIEDWKREFDSRQEWKGRTAVQMRRDKIAGAHAFSDAFKTWVSREAKGDIGLSSAFISRVMPYARNVILQDLSSISIHLSRSPDAKTFQGILSSLPSNPSNQNLSQIIRIENEEFKVYHVMFRNAGKIEGRWMIRRADAPNLVKVFGGSMPDATTRDDNSVLSVLED